MSYNISFFKNIKDANPAKVFAEDFLQKVKNGAWKNHVFRVRNAEKEAEKADAKRSLPAVTFSAVCAGGHAENNIIEHSGLICVDFDWKDNLNVSNFIDLKSLIHAVPYVYFCARSCGGKGFFALMPIADTSQHRAHCKAAIAYFAQFGLTADKSCIDPCRLRFVSYDPTPYINKDAKKFPFVIKEKSKDVITQHNISTYGDTASDVKKCLQEISARHLDLSADYATWVNVGLAFSREFGEDGREMFQIFSANYPNYDEEETNKKYNSLLKSPSGVVDISFFFRLCKDNCITYSTPRATAEQDFINIQL
jgi:hypothetical protein